MSTISSLPPVSGAAAPAAAALQATLEQLQHRLSDCVNCDSAATPRGKADIARIEAQIGLLRRRLEQPDAAATAAPVRAPSATLGSVIDVYS